jgi:riboflavin synthase
MFTGLVEEIGTILQIDSIVNGFFIRVQAKTILDDIKTGDSVALNGVCLTVLEKSGNGFSVEAVGETASRTTLAHWQPGIKVNLERALQPLSRIGGHFVQGHVDGVGKITGIETRDPGHWLQVQTVDSYHKFLVEKGSVAIDGISLTIAHIAMNTFDIAVISHTYSVTTLHDRRVGDEVNIEVDILGKYVYNFLNPVRSTDRISVQKLTEWGFE